MKLSMMANSNVSIKCMNLSIIVDLGTSYTNLCGKRSESLKINENFKINLLGNVICIVTQIFRLKIGFIQYSQSLSLSTHINGITCLHLIHKLLDRNIFFSLCRITNEFNIHGL